MGFAPSSSADDQRLKVLLVDDDLADRRVIRRYVASGGLGTVVEESASATDALELVRNGDYDCVLLDYRFPTGDAFELFSELLGESTTARPPIVLLTGAGDEQIAAQSIERGAQAYLPKAQAGASTLRTAIESALEKARKEREEAWRDAELTKMSFYDPLTELANRRLLLDRLDQAIREVPRMGGFAVLMLDLDLFKQVNDTHGHAVGDELLRRVARRLTEAVRQSDTVARLGGDEFAIVLRTVTELEGAVGVAQKIRNEVMKPIAIGSVIAEVGVSIGISMCPEHGQASSMLLRHADLALYDGKKSTRGIAVHGGTEDEADHEAALIAHDLGDANLRGQLVTLFQPQVRLRDGAIVGAEALVRWNHPELGILPARKFVPAAERTEVIEQLTYEVLEQSLQQVARWREQGIDMPVAVNLAPRLFGLKRLGERIAAFVEAAEVPAESLCLEVTETAIMTNPNAAAETLCELSDLGFSISIDDFGSGVSSLKNLRDLPIDEIKIDGLFMRGLATPGHADDRIVESVIAIGKAFGARVIAEGVETDLVWRRLLELGCEFGQGHRAGEPMIPEAFDIWRARWEGGPGR